MKFDVGTPIGSQGEFTIVAEVIIVERGNRREILTKDGALVARLESRPANEQSAVIGEQKGST